MNKLIHFCMLLIFIFNQGLVSNSAPSPDGNQSGNNLQTWRDNVLDNLKRTNTCLKKHYVEVFGLDYDERFSDITGDELRSCSEGNDSEIKEISTKFEANSKICSEVLRSRLEKKINIAEQIDLKFMSFSREELNNCFRNAWNDWKVAMSRIAKKLEPCVKENRKRTPRKLDESQSKSGANFCIIKNGVLSELF